MFFVFLMIKLCDFYCYSVYFYYGLIKKYSDKGGQNADNLVEDKIEVHYDAKLENLDSNSVSFDIDKRVEQMKGSLKQRMKDRVASYESNVEADDDTLEE